ncbi:hypothetical protein IWQ60_002117 [Tieghemiomyces parasiticus]|uniref:Uncharacterized protein n=1 Tax=Tieghemiomyces parasiticus TaxID=78921 RepID=A0A9W8AD88_9FUNG|nr:hypothetical protein IWQ60_002117 [Tieghemiomyces parasiticus]
MGVSKTCLIVLVLSGMLVCLNLGSEAYLISGIAVVNYVLGRRSIADLSYSPNGVVHHRRHRPVEVKKRAANKKGNSEKKKTNKHNDDSSDDSSDDDGDSNPGPYGDNNALEKINEGQKRNPKATEEPKAEFTIRHAPAYADMGGGSSDDDDHSTD